MLPVNSNTLLYGSNDGNIFVLVFYSIAGYTIHPGTEDIIQAMEKSSKLLNLKVNTSHTQTNLFIY